MTCRWPTGPIAALRGKASFSPELSWHHLPYGKICGTYADTVTHICWPPILRGKTVPIFSTCMRVYTVVIMFHNTQLHSVPKKVYLFISWITVENWPILMAFGVLDPENIWHQWLVLHLPTSPVYFSQFAFGNPKSHFSTVLFSLRYTTHQVEQFIPKMFFFLPLVFPSEEHTS